MREFSRLLLDMLLPPRCHGCGQPMQEAQGLCSACFARVVFVPLPVCECCGLPLGDAQYVRRCARCIAEPPHFSEARAAILYEGEGREQIHAFKFSDQVALAPVFARWMCSAGHAVLQGVDVLIPVPLSWPRLFSRRYNQAALLAKATAKAWKQSGQLPIEVQAAALKRTRHTQPQLGLKMAERRHNVKGAFALAKGVEVTGHVVCVVDDVVTTGATVDECALVLLAAGAKEVRVLSLARTLPQAMQA